MTNIKRVFLSASILLLCVTLVSSQSLVELAKRERERRAKLKHRSAKVITNADLKNRKTSPALTVRTDSPSPKRQAASPPRSSSSSPRVIVASDTQQLDQQEARGGSLKYATSVLPTTWYVDNPELALKKPDNQYAQVKFLGFIDLEFQATNNKGDDIAIYAKRQAQGVPHMYMNYVVYVKHDRGDWVGIGMGTGLNAPETFDLGDIQNINAIRVVVREITRRYNEGRIKSYPQEYSMAIDAIEAINIR